MISDEALYDDIRRLERDVRNFEARARDQKAVLQREGHCATVDPLYQRFVSLRGHLSVQLQQARAEASRRADRKTKRPTWSLRAGIASLLGVRG
jgi:hypothetical protein